jgi:hypothetical protein
MRLRNIGIRSTFHLWQTSEPLPAIYTDEWIATTWGIYQSLNLFYVVASDDTVIYSVLFSCPPETESSIT